MFVYIISFYIIILNTIPCVDDLGNSCSHKQEISHNSNSNHKGEMQDHCSPFCTCSCCATPILNQISLIHFECFTFTSKNISIYKPTSLKELCVSIWQPPKIS